MFLGNGGILRQGRPLQRADSDITGGTMLNVTSNIPVSFWALEDLKLNVQLIYNNA